MGIRPGRRCRLMWDLDKLEDLHAVDADTSAHVAVVAEYDAFVVDVVA